jgi:hypothetical protein
MLLLWIGTVALAISPALHVLFHQDAQGPDHNCLITQIQQYPLLAGLVAITAPVPALVAVAMACCAKVQLLPACDCRLAPSRAPPLLFFSTTVVG